MWTRSIWKPGLWVSSEQMQGRGAGGAGLEGAGQPSASSYCGQMWLSRPEMPVSPLNLSLTEWILINSSSPSFLPAVRRVLGWKRLPRFFNLPVSRPERAWPMWKGCVGDQEAPPLPLIIFQAGSSRLSNPNPSCCVSLFPPIELGSSFSKGKTNKSSRGCNCSQLTWLPHRHF